MFISSMELFKLGIGPSSSHTMGPMLAALEFRNLISAHLSQTQSEACNSQYSVRCCLFGSLAYTGLGHATDKAILLGLHAYSPELLQSTCVDELLVGLGADIFKQTGSPEVTFHLNEDLVFDRDAKTYPHPNFLRFELIQDDKAVLVQGYASLGGGFIVDEENIGKQVLALTADEDVPFPFESANQMLAMAQESGLSIAQMKQDNECSRGGSTPDSVGKGVRIIWQAMLQSILRGLAASGSLPGVLRVPRRAAQMHCKLMDRPAQTKCHEWLAAYAMAVNEENAAGHAVVTAPTNGAAGVIPAVLYFYLHNEVGLGLNLNPSPDLIEDEISVIETFLLTAAAIGGLIKHNSSISGAEVGCQGEVGAASAMAAAGLCAVKGGSPQQVENAAEIALEHHLGMTCDPVAGLVQVPCIERNAFGAAKATMAADMALIGDGDHLMSLDACIEAMRQTGMEMSSNYKETSLGGLAKTWVEC
jgi:L-serine dehydratase